MEKRIPESRSSGILLHPTSLPGPFGIGDIGPGAVAFVDWLKRAGQGVWQVLPLGPTGYGDSPYASFSSFAGNELLISPENLVRDGLLTDMEVKPARLPENGTVDYGTVIPGKRALVRKAAERLVSSGRFKAEFEDFRSRNALWLDDYAMFMDIKTEYDAKAKAEGVMDSSWNAWWPAPLAKRDKRTLELRKKANAASILLVEAEQFLFRTQWNELRAAANAKGIQILGDLPIFVAMDSADAWAWPELFRLDEDGHPLAVAGVPPDYFSADGQLWGNPLYAWDHHQADGFSWWISRVKATLSLYDMLRIDHFRGLSACWAVPAGAKNARKGSWDPAPGAALLTALRASLGGQLPIIAEDLGFITDDVRELRDGFGLPGMRILQFGFDAEESGKGLDPANPFLPHNYVPDCVAYPGTHDNDTLAGWLTAASDVERKFVLDYLGYTPADPCQALIREAMKSAAGLCVTPMQDLFGLGSEARMNIPSTLGGNWSWRLDPEALSAGGKAKDVAERVLSMTTMYNRLAKKPWVPAGSAS